MAKMKAQKRGKPMKLAEKIRKTAVLTHAERRILRFMEEDPDTFMHMSLEELSKSIYLSPSTINRFCKKAGYRGHKELCIALAQDLSEEEEVKPVDPSYPIEKDDEESDIGKIVSSLNAKALEDAYKSMDYNTVSFVAKKIAASRAVYVYASAEDYGIAEYFADALTLIGIRAYLFKGSETSMQMAVSQPADIPALVVTYDDKDKSLLNICLTLYQRNVQIHLIKGPYANPLSKFARTKMEIYYDEPKPKISNMGSIMAVKIVLDVLYAVIFRHDYDENMRIMKVIASARNEINDDSGLF